MNRKTIIDRIRTSKDKENGFTLIELLIVVVILGILAAVVIFASAGFKNKGAKESCSTTLSSVKTAVEAYHTDHPTALYPSNWADLTTATTFTVAAVVTNLGPYVDPVGVSAPITAGVNTVTGKGWTYTMTFDTVAPFDTPPTYAAAAAGITCGP